jgi:hypothetical protein
LFICSKFAPVVVGGVEMLDILDLLLVHQTVRHEPAADRGSNIFKWLKNFRTENGSSQGQNLAPRNRCRDCTPQTRCRGSKENFKFKDFRTENIFAPKNN